MTRAATVVLAAVALAGGATGLVAAAPAATYRLSVTATLQEQATYSLTGDAACFWTAIGVAVRHLDITSAPSVVTAAALARGVGVPLEVHEIRLANHNAVTGACSRLGPEVSDPSDGCGRRTYAVPAADVRLRLQAGRIGFSFLRVAGDPYANRCAPAEWAAIPRAGHAGLVATLRFPPRPSTAALDERRLRSGKPVVARRADTVDIDQPTLGRTDRITASWRVMLTLVQG